MTPVETTTMASIDVHLGPSRQTLRVSLHDAPGGPVLTLAAGFGGGETGDPFLRPDWAPLPLQIPAAALPVLFKALAALEEAP